MQPDNLGMYVYHSIYVVNQVDYTYYFFIIYTLGPANSQQPSDVEIIVENKNNEQVDQQDNLYVEGLIKSYGLQKPNNNIIGHLSVADKKRIVQSSILNLSDDEKRQRIEIEKEIAINGILEPIQVQNIANKSSIITSKFTALFIPCLFGLVLPIIQIAFAAKYQNDMVCNISTIVSPYTWLMTTGIIGLCFGVFTLFFTLNILTTATLMDMFLMFSTFCLIPFAFFSLAWMIVGSVMFWRDCNDMEPRPINQLISASLIIQYVHIGLQMLKPKSS